MQRSSPETLESRIQVVHVTLEGTLTLPADSAVPAHPAGVVLFAHGSGSGRHGPRNRHLPAAQEAAA